MSLLLLQDLVVVLAAAAAVLFVVHRLKLPPIAGLLATGVLIGPSALRLVRDTRTIDALAEVGVVMLLFTVGLEMPLPRIRSIGRDFWVGGGSQVAATLALAAVLLRAAGAGWSQAVLGGFLASLSSTSVVLRILSDRAEVDAPHGRAALGILIFQDLAVVPMVAVIPLLARRGEISPGPLALRFAASLALVAAVAAAVRYLLPRAFYAIVRTRAREIFLIASLLVGLGMALLTSSLGLSVALGAFLAGILMAGSEYSPQVSAEILPFRYLFNSVFFIAVGMLLNLRQAWREAVLVVVLAVSIAVLKIVVVTAVVAVVRKSVRVAVMTGLALAQIGEFSFVLAGVGRLYGLLPERGFQGFLASSILTIFATPFLIRASPAIAEAAERAFRRRRPAAAPAASPAARLSGHVVIAGFGLNGRNLARVLKSAGIPYTILELDFETVCAASAAGEPILFGDVSSAEILREAGTARAKAVVFAISDPQSSRRGVRVARALSRDAFIIVRTRYASEIEDLYRLGANEVIPEEFETSIEIFTRVLEEYHVPKNLVDAQVKMIRAEGYGILRGEGAVRPSMEKVAEILTAGIAETFYVGAGTAADGRTIGGLDLRHATGATVIAVVRGEVSHPSPGPGFRIEAGDTLVLMGSHQAMDAAFEMLGRPPGEDSGPEWPA